MNIKTLLLTILLLAFSGFLLSQLIRIVDTRGGDAAKGKPLYTTHCLMCHGPTGAGDGFAIAGLPVPPPNLQRSLGGWFEYDSLIIREVIMKGKIDAGMPAYDGVLDRDQAKDILAYLRSL